MTQFQKASTFTGLRNRGEPISLKFTFTEMHSVNIEQNFCRFPQMAHLSKTDTSHLITGRRVHYLVRLS